LTKHINNVFKEGELDVNSTCAKFAQVQVFPTPVGVFLRLADFYRAFQIRRNSDLRLNDGLVGYLG